MGPRARGLFALGACLVALPHASVEAGGFKVSSGGPPIGEVGAGSAAGGSHPSVVWFNPAAIPDVGTRSAAAVANVIAIRTRWRDEGSTNALGAPLGGDASPLVEETSLVPHLYAVHPITPRLGVGLSATSPFGLRIDYPGDWVGRYHATESELRTIDVGLSAGYRLTDQWSIGAGVNVQYADATLANAIDFGLIGLQVLGPAGAAAAGLAPGQDDGSVDISAESWGFGGNVGVLWRPRPATRLGLTWRSAIAHELRGDADFDVPANAAPLLASGRFQDAGVTSDITLPETIAFGASHEVGRWTLLLGVEWTRWSRFEELRIRFDNPSEPDSVQPEEWDDAFRVALGVRFRPHPRWTLRGGVAFDDSPVPDATRTPRLPDADRLWLGLGATAQIGRCLSLDLSALHEVVEDAPIRQTAVPVRGSLVGTAESSVTYVSFSMRLDF
jgi:long-chain fatty acid transport protein